MEEGAVEPLNSKTMKPLIRNLDCVQVWVSDLEAGLAFYRDQLGHQLIWRTETAVGLRLPETDTEWVLQTERDKPEVDLLVDSVENAVQRIEAAGGRVLVLPFDVPIGRCVVVEDPWANRLVLLDTSKGLLATDENGNVVGNVRKAEQQGDGEHE